ncbi:kinase binding protein CGI-121-domain-containing protein [Suillus clintonianus]|uniref:kinase binding protein CGI-121-domain-containing protein n=1 Tax=Suillus clintonianus TaxID=1904413 RepID=UPI001B86219E|nr:kinase binding protein CGI-121-domain-containing protein [Suillus clintonianus]KAG2139749.1 kinase binding protein CGI-121-domain-containing protein [Suillus clintonianus]
METYYYSQFNHAVVHVALFDDVTNAAAIRSRIVQAARNLGVDGNTEREAVNFAFIDARLISSSLHLQTAIYQALLSETQGQLRTKTVHSEILWALNPTNNITEAIRRYGVSDASTTLIVVRVDVSDTPNIQRRMCDIIQGSMVPFRVLGQITDWSIIKKHYKLDSESALKEVQGNQDRECSIIDNIVVSSVAMKNVAA